jgi:hypothetical protein
MKKMPGVLAVASIAWHGNPLEGIVEPLAWRPSGPVACGPIAADRTIEIKCRALQPSVVCGAK